MRAKTVPCRLFLSFVTAMQATGFHELMARYTEGHASADEVSRLNEILSADADARATFLRYCNLDMALQMEAAEVSLGPHPAPATWLSRPWRPSAAALLAGICGAVLGAGAAWGVIPQSRNPVRWSILSSGFERETEIRLRSVEDSHGDAIPGLVGSWQADVARITEAEHGVVPFSGTRMLAFEQALAPAGFKGESPRSCDLYQIIDLDQLRGEIAAGTSSLSLSARFFDASAAHDIPTLFELRIHFFSQPPEQVADFTRSRAAVATNVLRTSGQEAERGWRRLTVEATVPSNAVFAVVQISATRPKEPPQSRAAVFGRHYCDDVELTFTPAAIPER